MKIESEPMPAMESEKPGSIQFRRGFVIMDMVIGTAIVVIIGGLLAYTVVELNATTKHLAHCRNVLRRDQAMLYQVMAGQQSPEAVGGDHLHILRMKSLSRVGSIPPDYQWVFIATKSRYAFGHRLYALVPRSKQPVKAGGPHP